MSSDGSSGCDLDDTEATWMSDRTTFQRVYDVVTGLTAYQPANVVADRAQCSPDGARNALGQLTEMGVADQRGDRPVTYRRNESYFRWKRIERLAAEHTPEELRSRVEDLLDEDAELQREFGVPDPDAVPAAQVEETTRYGGPRPLGGAVTLANSQTRHRTAPTGRYTGERSQARRRRRRGVCLTLPDGGY